MSPIVLFAGAALSLALLGAYSQADDAADDATAAAARDAQADGAMMAGDAEMDRQMAAMTGPFADAERKMDQAMKSAVGVDVADTWTRKMIAHHQGAVDMARVFLDQDGGSEPARAMAQRTIDKQTKEIEELERLLKDGEPQQAAAQNFASAERDMMRAMMNARSDAITDSFLRKMLEHHKGGVAMSEIAIAEGGDAEILEKARKTRDDQAKEAEEAQAMLDG